MAGPMADHHAQMIRLRGRDVTGDPTPGTRYVIFVIGCEVPADATSEQLYNILCDAEVQVAEPNEDIDVETMNVTSTLLDSAAP